MIAADVKPPELAVTVATPAELGAIKRPAALTDPTVAEKVDCAVMLDCEPLLKLPVTSNCNDPLALTDDVAGEIWIDVSVAAAVIVTLAVALKPPNDARTVKAPGVFPAV